MLSLTGRKVAHALLTRPPLSQIEIHPKISFKVLRSTWMCYARRQRSSWARIKLSNYCIYPLPLDRSTYQSRSALLLFKSFIKIINSKEFFGAFSLSVLLFNFQGAFLASVKASLDVSLFIISQHFTIVKHFFWLFSKKFFVLFYFSPCLDTAWSLYISYTLLSSFFPYYFIFFSFIPFSQPDAAFSVHFAQLPFGFRPIRSDHR